ncbi:hypothetical protein Cgig2_019415 [Carnegiea gigantea]|uniref:Endonuclease/exonuclease/phosphatase domain-containing protein n=1 Tax=Carnegiea gigantea TaxID=171969 RepID=A0A9Q1QMX8_9CARY|nr:hypothetical protein Cgig2_019415 [Carnegiea gigantea]
MEMEIVTPRLGDYHGVYVDCRGRAGGLALLWGKTVNLTLQSYSSNHMDAHICWEGVEVIYGWPETQHKHKTCAMIADLSTHSNLPWIVGETLTRSSTIRRKKWGQLDTFREAFIDVGLFHLGFEGYEFTWNRCKDGMVVVEERLDKFCASTEWSLMFPDATITHINSDISDHLPVILRCHPRRSTNQRHFGNIWTLDLSGKEAISQAWAQQCDGNAVDNLLGKVERCGTDLSGWNLAIFSQVGSKIKELKISLKDSRDPNKRRTLQGELREWSRKEEITWWL